jgi:hypothetical protein
MEYYLWVILWSPGDGLAEREPLVDIRWFKSDPVDAEAEVMRLDRAVRNKALALLKRLSQRTRSQFRIKPTYVGKIMEAKLRLPEGGLRVLFVYGKAHVWCIGAFVKRNEKEGNAELARYLHRSQVAEEL